MGLLLGFEVEVCELAKHKPIQHPVEDSPIMIRPTGINVQQALTLCSTV